MQDAKSCPYCGGSRITTFFQIDMDPGWYFTECSRCFCRGPRSWTTQDSVGAWNGIPRDTSRPHPVSGEVEEGVSPTTDHGFRNTASKNSEQIGALAQRIEALEKWVRKAMEMLVEMNSKEE